VDGLSDDGLVVGVAVGDDEPVGGVQVGVGVGLEDDDGLPVFGVPNALGTTTWPDGVSLTHSGVAGAVGPWLTGWWWRGGKVCPMPVGDCADLAVFECRCGDGLTVEVCSGVTVAFLPCGLFALARPTAVPAITMTTMAELIEYAARRRRLICCPRCMTWVSASPP
jgi:hypothetical protein